MSSRYQSPYHESRQESKIMGDLGIPLGFKYRFAPEDHELITYLSCKANGEPLPNEEVIKEVALYDMNDPGKLFRGSQENIAYVFTKVKKVAENGKRVDRKVIGNRTWKGVDKGQPIYDKEGRLVGEKRRFNFMNKMKVRLQYNMTEFVLDKRSLSHTKLKDYVLCQIKKKLKKGRAAQEEDFGSLKSAIEEEKIDSIEEEVNSSMALNSLVTEANIPFPNSVSEQYFSQNLQVTNTIPNAHCAAEQYCCQNLLVTNGSLSTAIKEGKSGSIEEEVNSSMPSNSLVTEATIPLPNSVSEQYFSRNLLVSNTIPNPQIAAGQYCCQNSLVPNGIAFHESGKQCCPFSGVQEGTSNEQIASVAAFGNTMMVPELFEAPVDWTNNLFLEFAQNQKAETENIDDLAIWDMINDLASSSPSVSLNDHGIFSSASALSLTTNITGY